MGLWLKCPGCQTKNPISLRVCPKCGRSLDNLPREARVYVIGPPEAAATALAALPAAAAGPEASKPAKKPKKPRKKKI